MNFLVGEKEYVRCELCDAFATITNASKLDWDWFTGYLPRTHHYCKAHADSMERNFMYENSLKRPVGTP